MLGDVGNYIERYRDNYPLWMEEMLGASITDDQKKLNSGFVKERFASAKSGTGTGKTAYAATSALWFLTTRPESKIPCTAPTGHQLEDLLFAEMETWIRRIKWPFMRNAIKMISGKIYIDGYRDWFIVARTIPKDSKDKLGDVLAGFHAPHLYFIVDEASRVPDNVFAGIEGSMTQKGVYCLLVGNPTQCNGYFYDTHHKNRDQWFTTTLSSLRSPFTDTSYIERIKLLHGEDSDFYRTKVLGEFPLGGGSSIITLDQVRAAQERWHEVQATDFRGEGTLIAGLDPASGRNDYSILTFRRGSYIFEPVRIMHKDTQDVLPKISSLVKSRKCRELCVEYDGLGINMYDWLKKQHGFRTYKVVMTSRANDPEAYRNTRAELYLGLRDNFEELYLPDHDRYIYELPEINLEEDKSPQQLEDKKKLKSRLGFSPDYADSLTISTARHFNLANSGANYESDAGSIAIVNNKLRSESSFVKI